MGASRLTREEVLERQVLAATVAFAATFAGVSYALVPYAIELPAAFSRADTGNFPFTPQHVSIGASRLRRLMRRRRHASTRVGRTRRCACLTRSATRTASSCMPAWRAAARDLRLRVAAVRVAHACCKPLTDLLLVPLPHAAQLTWWPASPSAPRCCSR